MPGKKLSMADENTHSGLVAERKELLGYEEGADEEETESGRWSGENAFFGQRPRKWVPRPSTLRAWVLLVLVVSTAWSLGAAVGYLTARALNQTCTVLECVKMTSSYSPLLEVVEYHDYQFEAELSAQNIYKGHPRPELDTAWERVGRIHPISMPTEYRGVLNKTHSGIEYPEELGGGIMVEIEVFHQLHCLDFLRKIIYADYYSRPGIAPIEFQVTDKMMFNHIDHCVDFLRQFIMCSSDVTPVTSNWVHGHHSPHPDFNTMHKCRNFDQLLEWVEEHDNGGVPRQTPNPSWWPAPKLDKTVLDYEPDFPVPPHGPHPDDDGDRWGSN